ncbi:DNA-binding transcriptional LysR family regulator [Kibdelosporangium banguiense]|uniref:DNA-binding transcriptional LysR family regulator n=1 Tax=Kibdelosporangium banguiense TaxID=1365924 RepID=A0ABS4TPU7_9PSEU|nr:LysR family transcriptional regulator [Kibdelosporangium banguiense]MBP2326425.1 DNA-binding transcriptional LysR family regulator [Kibdelosporangium banguiense]
MTLDQIKAFVAVAEELHFGRAAQRLRMTQPPLSRHIQKLERIVGVALLKRDSQRVLLTDAGRAFLEEARRMLTLVDTASDRARRIASGAAGTVRLGFTAVSAISTLGTLLRQLSEHLPEIDVILHERVTAGQVDGVLRGELDLGLARPPFNVSSIDSRVVFREPLCAVLPVGHPLTTLDRALTPDDFDGQPIVSYNPGQARYFHELTVQFLTNAHPRIEQQVHQILTAVLLVAAGRGVALAPASARSLGINGVVLRDLIRGGSDPLNGNSGVAGKPVELHAIWDRGSTNPALWRVLDLLPSLD